MCNCLEELYACTCDGMCNCLEELYACTCDGMCNCLEELYACTCDGMCNHGSQTLAWIGNAHIIGPIKLSVFRGWAGWEAGKKLLAGVMAILYLHHPAARVRQKR